jgi:hypothetical protein
MEARERRRLVVTNANVVPSSSESEVEYTTTDRGFKTRLPVLANKWELASRGTNNADSPAVGLGFDFSKQGNQTENYGGTTRDAQTDDDDSSVYDDHEPEPDKTVDSIGYLADRSCFSAQSRSSIDKLDEAHGRRREALLGIVNGLEAGLGTTFADVCRNEESDYCGQEGLAISGSGDVGLDEYSQDRLAHHRTPTMPLTSDTTPKDHDQGTNHRTNIALVVPSENVLQDLKGRRSPRENMVAGASRSNESGFEPGGNLSENIRWASRSPIIRRGTDIALPAALRRYSVYDACDSTATPRDLSGKESVFVEGKRTHAWDTTAQDQSSEAVAARERKALGIPPSDSDGIFQRTGVMAHTDSVLSSVDSALSLQGCDELSFGAEELFRKLSGKSDFTSFEKSSDTGGDHTNILPPSPPKPTWRNPASGHTNAPSHCENLDSHTYRQCQAEATAPDSQKHGRRSFSLSKATGDSLPDQNDELELRRQEVIRELWETEKNFVQLMRIMIGLFIRPLRMKNTRVWIAGVPPDVARLFDWLEDILNLHKQIFSVLQTSLAGQSRIVKRVAAPLRNVITRFEVYQPYMVRLGDVTETIQRSRQASDNDFGEFVLIQERSPDCRGWNLERFLTEPLNRLESYPNLFGVSGCGLDSGLFI